MRSSRINGEGEVRGQPVNPGSPGTMAVEMVCVTYRMLYTDIVLKLCIFSDTVNVFEYVLYILLLLPAGLPRSEKLPVLNLLTGQKSAFSPVGATRCTDSRHTWRGRKARGSAWLCKISSQSAPGWECGPKI